MLTDFFNILNNDVNVKVLMGANPLRVYPYGTKLDGKTRKPYALYGLFNAVPYNFLKDRTDMDLSSIQVDIYAMDSDNATACYNAIRSAIEGDAYITNYSTPERDIDDGLYHVRLEVDFHDER